MNNLFYVEGKLTEEQFRNKIDGIELSEIEIEFLRRYYGLPYNYELVLKFGTFRDFVIAAQQKIRGNPMMQMR